jgi:hypothetical protein
MFVVSNDRILPDYLSIDSFANLSFPISSNFTSYTVREVFLINEEETFLLKNF